MNKVFLLLGANLGNPATQLAKALDKIESQVGKIEACSSLYESEAWGVTDQPIFLNQVVLVSTSLSPLDVLNTIQAIEDNLGRVRISKWGARVIDIDILYFNHDCIQHERLIVPHPYLPDRRFVLIPLSEIAPSFTHPKLGITTVDLLTQCEDNLDVHLYNPNDNDAIQTD
ncbi:MAG TPA: 2-amino-4-hydroxy-6-hydroxymethyldihydropteridine diphosphokinase [Sphingobacterium sp.]|jgi:2-amino-4-hydroxy-6-hydroxymethyldihydropteridine diphosphokinase|nr:2-amino-4-hydroxy-6-hydroxymethyldihydropteridine diphosphokinase [Sphingobacterium sp.]